MRRFFLLTAAAVMLVLSSSAETMTRAAVPNDDRSIVHALNRIGFGPRPGDVDRVRAMGLQAYIDRQLHPDKIADQALAAHLPPLTTLGMSAREIAAAFEIPQLEARRQRQRQAGANGGGQQPPAQADPATQRRNNQPLLELSQNKVLRAIYSERQLQEVLTDFWFNHFNVDARKGRDRFLLTEYERDAIRPHVLGKFRELLGATAKSPAMLFYLDNWMSSDPDGPSPDGPDRRRIRRIGPDRSAVVPLTPAEQKEQAGRRKRGLNENYGRELMELHTLGVDGGYTQKDVTEVARAFTGWTIGNPRQGGGYVFNPRLHDPGEKVVLGHTIKAGGGERDGEQVLDILARRPATAQFIAMQLVRRFVADVPPTALVTRAAVRFLETDGDLRDVMRTILTSPEFFAPEAYRAKVKTPFEFVVSAARTTGAAVDDAMPLVRALQQLGMPLYACQPPTGYKDTAEVWVNTGALVNRMNIALSLASNRLRGVTIPSACGRAADPSCSTAGRSAPLDAPSSAERVEALVHGEVSASTRATIATATTPAQVLALSLGSPEFQRR